MQAAPPPRARESPVRAPGLPRPRSPGRGPQFPPLPHRTRPAEPPPACRARGPCHGRGGDPDWQARMGATWVAGEAAPTLGPGRRGLKAQGRELEVLGSPLPSPGLRGSSSGAAPRLLQAAPALGPGQDEGCARPRPRPAPGDTHPATLTPRRHHLRAPDPRPALPARCGARRWPGPRGVV